MKPSENIFPAYFIGQVFVLSYQSLQTLNVYCTHTVQNK